MSILFSNFEIGSEFKQIQLNEEFNTYPVILFFFNHLSFAQYSNLKFENFDTNDGLSSITSVEVSFKIK